jgi:hypothetical protein
MGEEIKIPYPEKIVFAGAESGHFWFVTFDGERYSFWREYGGKLDKPMVVHPSIDMAFWGLKEAK